MAAHPPQVKLSYLVVIWHDHSHRKEICLFCSRLGFLVLRMLRGRPHEKFTLAFAVVLLERNKLLGLRVLGFWCLRGFSVWYRSL